MPNGEKQEIKVGLDPNLYALTNVNIGFSEEVFDFLMISGNQARQFRSTPKQAKRILLLLQQKIDEYQKKFGDLKTQLPEKKRATETESKVGFGQ